MQMQKYFYSFGFEDPLDMDSNNSCGTDFESCRVIAIFADDEHQALQWGNVISKDFVNWLFAKEGRESPSWSPKNYANWIDSQGPVDYLGPIPEVTFGQLPEFSALETA